MSRVDFIVFHLLISWHQGTEKAPAQVQFKFHDCSRKRHEGTHENSLASGQSADEANGKNLKPIPGPGKIVRAIQAAHAPTALHASSANFRTMVNGAAIGSSLVDTGGGYTNQSGLQSPNQVVSAMQEIRKQ